MPMKIPTTENITLGCSYWNDKFDTTFHGKDIKVNDVFSLIDIFGCLITISYYLYISEFGFFIPYIQLNQSQGDHMPRIFLYW